MWRYGMNWSCMGFLKICNGSWHMCKVHFVASFITICEICDIYWLQFCTNITSWSWFYYIPYSNVKKSFYVVQEYLQQCPSCKDKCSPTSPIYLWSKVVCFVFVLSCDITSCWDLSSHSASCRALGIFGKVSIRGVHWLGLGLFWSYVMKAVDYWTIFSMKSI